MSCIAAGYFYVSSKQTNTNDLRSEQIILLNEIEQLAQSGNLEEMSEKTADLQEELRNEQQASAGVNGLPALCVICLIFLITVSGYVYFQILRPFDKMKLFAEKIAQGNFDIPLDYGRSNYFGAFTWAFDSMRCEITKSRACEKEAIDNNKTVIATLSHDIKTPIASIRAYAEGLEANLDNTHEKRAKYLRVLMRKCDEVSKLTDDLFIHSISDLDKLKTSLEETEICEFMKKITAEISGEQNDVNFTSPEFSPHVMADRKRLTQIAENLINNARKYAKTQIDVNITNSDGFINISFRDYGNGIPDEDMPFILDKFYRGRNCGNEQGSGLGLYIVKYIAEQMKGKVSLHNLHDGLEVTVSLPEISV